MMFELKRFLALGTFELAENRTLVVTYHVPLEAVYVGKRFVAHLARLKKKTSVIRNVSS